MIFRQERAGYAPKRKLRRFVTDESAAIASGSNLMMEALNLYRRMYIENASLKLIDEYYELVKR